MSYLKIYDKKISEYELWLKSHMQLLDDLEKTILQNDNLDKVQEKIISIGFASLFVSIASGIVGLFGVVAVGFVGGVVLFIIGWTISQIFNRKIFGRQRKIENISESEKDLLNRNDILKKELKAKSLRVRLKKEKVYFSYYTSLKHEVVSLNDAMRLNNSDNLAYKYRIKYSMLKKSYIININKFEQIYAHKVRR